MIISASRRTDIPSYYSDWFINRIKDGYVYIRNPFNKKQISKVSLSKDAVDCIVFWTKNPKNMIDKLDELNGYDYYFQFTLTSYGKDIEPNLPNKSEELISVFKRLSYKIGKDKVIWRYDPILLSDKYDKEYHLRAFEKISNNLKGYTNKVIISFIDLYDKTIRNTKDLNLKELNKEDMMFFAKNLSITAKKNNMMIETCAEEIDLSEFGVGHGHCIDKDLIENIIGCKIKANKNKNQRPICGCMESIDIGSYNTCLNGCRYCYANFSKNMVVDNLKLYDVASPILCDEIREGDKIYERRVESLKENQMSLL
ncbi:DUF1848 domain-containing protein [uncultured Anaerofustis sp.]|uniref:DUF1848 domain-containing protein n=1 Tax=uncultured Anaerofustis sp. TaxID=904996 RepID=UPI0025FA656E|nr:DUF1848 domain-containing protein [uncultured Anaerofustis sp.]